MKHIFYDTKQFIAPLLGEEIIEQLLDLYVIADNAVRRELDLSFVEINAERSLDAVIELARNIHLVAIRLYGFDKELIDRYLVKGKEFASKQANSIKLIEK